MKTKRRFFIVISCLLLLTSLVIYKNGYLKKRNFENVITFNVVHGLPLIPVEIYDQKLQLILDLGAHFSSLSEKAIAQIPLTKTTKETRSMNGYGQKNAHQVFSASNITIGNYLLPYLEFNSAHPLTKLEKGTPKVLTYGAIGREPFLNKVLFIDRKKGICIVDQAISGQNVNPQKYQSGDWFEADFNLDKALGITLCLMTDHGEKELILDTGANISLINDSIFSLAPLDTRNATTNLSLKLPNEKFLGIVPFYSFNFSDIGLQGILGFDFFDQYMICLDFLNKKIFFKPYK